MHAIFCPEAANRPAVEQTIAQIANGWQRIAPGLWLMGTHVGPEITRDAITQTVPGELAVLRLHGGWATAGCDEIVEWLQAARRIL